MTTKTYRGRSLEELLPQVRAELGPDAVIVRQREGLTGGVGGFFQRKLVEIEASAPEGGVDPFAPGADPFAPPAANGATRAPNPFAIDVTDDTPATPDFLAELSRAEEAVEDHDFIAFELPEVVADDAWSGWRDPVPAPAVTPYVTDQVADVPEPELLPARREVAARAPLPARWPAEATTLRDLMVARGVDGVLADEVVEETVTHLAPLRSGAKLKPLVVSALAQRIPVKPIGGLAGRVVAFVGPGGSGKTHCASRLAGAYAAADRMPVRCVSIAPRDAGAELALLLAPAGVPLQTAPSGAQAAEQIADARDHALVLVDTPAVSPRAKGDLRALHAELRALGADDVLLTLPATSSAGAARELVAAGKRVGACGVVLTHADETEHLGPAIGVAMESGLPFAYVGERAALRPAAAEELAGALLGSSRGAAGRR